MDDAGPGVAASDQPNLFDEPTSFMDILDADDCGTNRGLVVCQHIITTHGGDLAMHNRPEGGAHFEFRLPTSANSTTSSVQSDLVSIHPSIAAVA